MWIRKAAASHPRGAYRILCSVGTGHLDDTFGGARCEMAQARIVVAAAGVLPSGSGHSCSPKTSPRGDAFGRPHSSRVDLPHGDVGGFIVELVWGDSANAENCPHVSKTRLSSLFAAVHRRSRRILHQGCRLPQKRYEPLLIKEITFFFNSRPSYSSFVP